MGVNVLRHGTVYREDGIYAGWPANHGAWQWDDELLVGFLRGPHVERQIGGHNIRRPFEKVLARSQDGGESWSVEIPNVSFEAQVISEPPPFDLKRSIIRMCGVYDHGGEECDPCGGFYLSSDRGRAWTGAFSFRGLAAVFDGKRLQCTSRTCLTEGGLIFLSAAWRHSWGTDFVFCARHDGEKFVPVSVVLHDDNRAVMPAVAEIGGRTVVALRRLGAAGCWIDAFASDDRGETWLPLGMIGETGHYNGNPPALVACGGKLVCAYGDRDAMCIKVAVSTDLGETWSGSVIRRGANPDVGYPRLFRRSDGNLVCVYYWSDAPADPQRIEATVFSA